MQQTYNAVEILFFYLNLMGKFLLETIDSHRSPVIVVPNTENLSNFTLFSVNTLVLEKNVFKKIKQVLFVILPSVKENSHLYTKQDFLDMLFIFLFK